MIEKLPYYYRKSQVVKDIYSVVQTVLDNLQADISAENLQLFIATTDDFELHEKDVGLSEITADNETKRARVIARLHGNNLLTKSELENLIRVYDKTGCTITEDFENHTVTVLFSDRTGMPHNLTEIQAAIEEVKPAHLSFEYEFQKNTWNDVRRKLGTWSNAKAFAWDGVQSYDGRTWLYIDGDGEVYLKENGANAYVVLKNDVPYARLL